MGKAKFVTVYTLAGIAGNVLSCIVNPRTPVSRGDEELSRERPSLLTFNLVNWHMGDVVAESKVYHTPTSLQAADHSCSYPTCVKTVPASIGGGDALRPWRRSKAFQCHPTCLCTCSTVFPNDATLPPSPRRVTCPKLERL